MWDSGGFDLALNRLGHECVYANEWDKYAAQTYEKNFSNIKYTGTQDNDVGNESDTSRSNGKGGGTRSYDYAIRVDTRSITDVPTSELPDFDLLVGGFPCQAFSIAGKRRGFDDTRGTLFFDIARILKDKRPRYFILENVKGLLSHDSGKTFQTILRVLTDIGYECQWQVLNSKNFGVPQNRERIFIVGHSRTEPRPKVFPIGASGKQNDEERILAHTLNASDWRGGNRNQKQTTIALTTTDYKQPKQIMNPLHNKTPYGWHFEQNVYDEKGITRSLKAGGGSGNTPKIMQLNNPTHSNDRVYGTDGVSPTLNTMQGGRRQPKIVASRGRNPKNPSDRRTGSPTEQRLEVNENGTTNTLTNVQKDNWVLENMRIRRLTPLECLRLQGFPDDWFDVPGLSDTQKYKQAGNAVSVPVVYAVAERLNQKKI